MPQSIPPAVAAQIVMQPQPPVDNSHLDNVTATAEFDPPTVRPGDKVFYRVSITAMGDSIVWPKEIAAPAELQFGSLAHAQLTLPDGTPFHPLTEFLYEATPTAAGHFVISNFSVAVGHRRIEVPAASIEVDVNAAPTQPRKLALDVSDTNLFFGQPFRVRVVLPAVQGQIEALRDVQLNSGEILPDEFATRHMVETVSLGGQLQPASIYETIATPLTLGTLMISAQAFTAGNQFNNVAIRAPVTIRGGLPNFELLVSDPVRISVRPLPLGELPGFTGVIGKFFFDPPQLVTNRLRVGEPVQLKFTFHGEGDLTHFVPPAVPRSRDWQIIADKPPASGFTLIPQTDAVTNTPAIPFCAFNPQTGKYYNLTIPALPVTVIGDGLPVNLPALENENPAAAPVKLSDLATSAGKPAASLKPLQLRGWFVLVQFLPVAGFVALWQWDRRRRFWEAHPDLFRRRQARRALRREKCKLDQAIAGQDAAAFLQCAVNALRIAAAPHFPAEPRALVCTDVLALLDAQDKDGRTGETVRKVFAAADTQFAATTTTQTDLLALATDVVAVLQKLEEKL